MLEISAPLRLPNGQVLPNRIAKAAMTEGLADPNGSPTEALCRLYERWSHGGAGLLITGNTAIDRSHLERAGNVVIDGDLDRAAGRRLAELAGAAQSGGSRAWVQISHAGRQTPKRINPHPQAPSAIPMRPMPLVSFGPPVEMTSIEVAAIAERFVCAARNVEEAGFDGVQVHAAHGYLLSSFLSPLANQRQDSWGGDLERRARLLRTIIDRVRETTSDSFAVSVKLNSADFQRGGFELDDCIKVARWLDEAGIDLLEISGGNYEAPRMMGNGGPATGAPGSTAAREAYFIEFAPRIREALTRAALMVTGGFRSRDVMNAAISDGKVDVVGLARPLLVEPEAAAELLDGRSQLRSVENELRLGPGILSQQTPFPFLKAMNASASQAWYYEQMDRLGTGQEPAAPAKLLTTAWTYLRRDARKCRAIELAVAEEHGVRS
jgi:2,4-dienoyl-CoA reductase-like NADH-dependent reductase (Old Yellow Enzyme family)